MTNIEKAINNSGLSQKEIAISLGVSQPTVSNWKSGEKFPSRKKLPQIAALLNVSVEYLLGPSDVPYAANSGARPSKDEKDIMKRIDSVLNDLDSNSDGLMFDGEPIDDETRELVSLALEHGLRMAKVKAKKKYTPKKYRKDE